MANGSFKIWVKYAGNIAVNWNFLRTSPIGSLQINRYGAFGTPCYGGCAEVMEYNTSSGSFAMYDDGTEWLYISLISEEIGVDAATDLYVEDGGGVKYDQAGSGYELSVTTFGGQFSFDGYIPTGSVNIYATASTA